MTGTPDRARREGILQGDLKNVESLDLPPRMEADIWVAAGAPSILEDIPEVDTLARAGVVTLVCPWMRGLPAADGPWLAALSIHDCNSYLEGAPAVTPAPIADCYFGVFALDRLRSVESLLALLRARRIRNIVNFPSVSFFDGNMAQTLTGLGYSLEAEVRFLAKAREAGFGIGFCSNQQPSAATVQRLDPAIWLQHAGAGRPFIVNPRQRQT
jgi:predicted TIM-barrel enzyme